MDTKIDKTYLVFSRYITYAFYQSDGRRISAFAEHTDGDTNLKVYLYNCSTKDQFSKVYAKGMHKAYKSGMWGAHTPEILEVEVDSNYPKRDFLRYMSNNYCRISKSVQFFDKITPIIVNNKGEIKKKLKSKSIIKISKI